MTASISERIVEFALHLDYDEIPLSVVDRIEDPERGIWRGLALQWTALQPGGSADGLRKRPA